MCRDRQNSSLHQREDHSQRQSDLFSATETKAFRMINDIFQVQVKVFGCCWMKQLLEQQFCFQAIRELFAGCFLTFIGIEWVMGCYKIYTRSNSVKLYPKCSYNVKTEVTSLYVCIMTTDQLLICHMLPSGTWCQRKVNVCKNCTSVSVQLTSLHAICFPMAGCVSKLMNGLRSTQAELTDLLPVVWEHKVISAVVVDASPDNKAVAVWRMQQLPHLDDFQHFRCSNNFSVSLDFSIYAKLG